MEPFKDSCDHCKVIVPKERWTFDLKQCVVCDKNECKAKQKAVLKDYMDTIVEGMLKGMIENAKS